MTSKYQEKKAFYQGVLSRLECQICGIQDSCVLEFHHMFDYKDENVSRLALRYSPLRILSEIAISACLCRNDHARVHYGQLDTRLLKRVDISQFADLLQTYYKKKDK